MERVQPIKRLWQTTRDALSALWGDPSVRRRSLIAVAAVLVCVYAAGVIWYVLSVPEIGIRCAFTTKVDRFFPSFLYPEDQAPLQGDDTIVQIGARRLENWPQLLRHMVNLRQRTSPEVVTERAALDDPRRTHVLLDGQEIIRVQAQRQEKDGTLRDLTVWCRLGRSPWETLLPTVLWFFIKAGLFLVGALVFWKRPAERSARIFFLLCIVSCGAYLGGYHWQGIATQPALLLVFMVCSVLLPPISLHFYLLFPRPKPLFERRPRTTLALLYGPPLAFLGLMLLVYRDIRRLRTGGPGSPGSSEDMRLALEEMLHLIYCYFAIALVWYLLSIWCLIHSYRTAQNGTERNQVKWILSGAVAALAPLGFSLYLALFEKDKFGGGDAAWPMFCASLFVTVAFTISITRYRLMQLDQLVSSGAVYLAVSVLAVVVYYGLVFAGVLLLGSRIAPGPFGQALGVSAIVLGLMAVLNLARSRLKKALDRHFRREKYQLERTLQRMSEAVGQLVDPPTLARRFLQTTTDLLGVERGAVYLREGAPPLFRVADTVGPAPPLTELPPGCPLVEELLTHGSLSVRPPHGNGTPAEPKAALRQLQFLGGEVAFALTHEGRMLALLVLGPRSVRDVAGGAFTGEDLNVLSAFAQVTVLALVSGEGGRTIEALNRELQTKVEKIAEQQRRILALQTQLTRRQRVEVDAVPTEEPAANAEAADHGTVAAAAEPAQGDIVGSGPTVRQLLQLVRKVAGADAAVLLRGESGTGKELLARAVHDNSPRSRRPFVRVHCAALHANLLESELFGHVKGAFTGAVRDRPGRFELAHGGTLFLDEIGDVSWEVQTKLLRVIQEKTFERVGSSEPIEVDVRIIAATHRNLEKLIRQERFREDLFYRLNVFPVQVPPLRARREDIPELVQHFLRCYGQRCGKGDVQLDDDALATLKAAPWPGNVRQLENAIARAVVIAEGTVLTVADLSTDLLVPPAEEEENPALEEPVVVTAAASAASSGGGVRVERADRDRREREQLVRALASTQGNKAEAARALGLARSTLVSRLKKHGLS